MIVRLGVLVAVAAYAVRRVNTRRSSAEAEKPPPEKDGEAILEVPGDDEEELFRDFQVSEEQLYVEEEEEKVKRINSATNLNLNHLSEFEDEEREEFFTEFEELCREIDIPPREKYEAQTDVKYEDTAENEAELKRLCNLVKELEEREVKLQGELLEYYGLKEQESDIAELQKQLKIKTAEIEMLNETINTLQAERKKLQDEVTSGMSAKRELEASRNKMKELQRQIELESSRTKGQLQLLKQQVIGLKQKEEEAAKAEAEIQRRLRVMKELEIEVVELRRRNKELQHEKRELTIKLEAAEEKASQVSDATENEMVTKAREDIIRLRHANEDLSKQVEGLQMNRFSEVEELVYLRWVNACLRYELRNYQTPSGKTSARDLNKNLSPRSQEKAKKLMLEYAGSERGQGDTDVESICSHPESPGSDDDNASIDSSSSRFSTVSKKTSLIQKLKRWGKSKDDYSTLSSPSRSFGGGWATKGNAGSKSSTTRGPLETLMLRNAGDGVAITTFGKRDEESSEILDDSDFPRVSTDLSPSDSLNSVATSFQLMSKSVEGVAEDKYPAYKDRHKLALEREKAIKEKAELARTERFGGFSDSPTTNSNFGIRSQSERALPPLVLPPKLAQIKNVTTRNESARSDSARNESNDQPTDSGSSTPVISKIKLAHIEKRAPRVPRPPPRSSSSNSTADAKATDSSNGIPLPPPPPSRIPPPPPPPGLTGGPPAPPPPPGSLKGSGSGNKVNRAPELVELYQSLMKRESKKDSTVAVSSSPSNTADIRSNMIGEIANRSTFLLAVKADVETQGEFVESLAREVRAASFTSIEELVAFVNWLDEELSFLVDERAVLKHFDWPEGKADALREVAFEYQDLAKLEAQVSSFEDDPKLPCEPALKKMYSLLEKVEQSVYALLRTRDMAISRYRDFGFPTDWLMDSGIVGKIKLSSVQLARKYMKRVSLELDGLTGKENEPAKEFLLLQGVRFAFRVHQFAGGFDAESMQAFEELRSRVGSGTPAPDTPQT